jgi:TonB family protein
VGYRAKLDPPSLNGPAPQALAQDQTTTPDEAALAQAVQEYRQFIATYPDSPEAAEARKRLTEIEAAPPGIQKRLAYAQAATETAKARVFYALPPGGHQLSAYLRKVQSDLAASSRDQQPGSATPAQQSSSPPLELFLDVPDAPHEPMRSIPNVLSSMVDPVPEPAKEKHVQGQVVLQPGPVPPLDEAAAGVKQFGGDVKPPAIISEPQPEYTDLARTDKVQGAVLVSLVVDEHGLPRHVRVLRGLGDGLDEKAIEAVNRYHFKPAMQNDKPVPVYATIDVNFALPAPAAQRADAASPAAPIPPADAPARVPSGALADNLISKVDPVYPEIARAAHVQGAVILHALISKTGTVEKLNVISGPPMLVKSAMDAVQQWKYKPYIVNGQPVEVSTTITVNFALADQPAAASPPSSTPTLFVNSTDADAAAADTQAEQRDRDRAANLRKIGGTVSAPVLMYEVEPKFSEDARKAKVAGTVLVSLIVDPSGLPQNVHVVRGIEIGPDGKPNPTLTDEARAAAATLDQNAVDAVNKYKFKPAMEDGKPVPVLLNIEINYKLF